MWMSGPVDTPPLLTFGCPGGETSGCLGFDQGASRKLFCGVDRPVVGEVVDDDLARNGTVNLAQNGLVDGGERANIAVADEVPVAAVEAIDEDHGSYCRPVDPSVKAMIADGFHPVLLMCLAYVQYGRRMEISIQQLRMLREVANQGTIAAAAEKLGYTPSAVSQQLSAVEKVTGIAVLERVGRNVMLTDAGRELVRHAEMVLTHLEKAQAAIEQVHGAVSGTLRLGFLESIGGSMLGPLIGRLREEYPDLSMRTRWVDGIDPLALVGSGELDMAFTVDYPSAPNGLPAGLAAEQVCVDWFRIVAASSRWAGVPPSVMDVADLATDEFIAPPWADSCGKAVTLTCRRAGFEPDVAHEVPDYPATLRLVAAGIGVSLVPDLGLRIVPDGVAIIDPKDPVCRTVELVYRTSSSERPAIRAVADAVHQLAIEMGLDRGE